MTTTRKPRPRPATARAGGAAASHTRRAGAARNGHDEPTTRGPGRPLAGATVRDRGILVRVSDKEHAALVELAEAEGTTLAGVLRDAALTRAERLG